LTEILLLLLAGLLLAANLGSGLAAHSLREFSRSRLEEICRARGRHARFGTILKRHEDTLLVADMLFMLATAALISFCVVWLSLWEIPDSNVADWPLWSVKLLLLAFAVVLLAVVFPWTIARVAGERYLCFVWPLLFGLLSAAKPVLSLARKIDRFVHRLGGVQEPVDGDAFTLTEEIRTVVDEGQREGVLESEARTMIHRVMELQEEDAAAIMTPRTEMGCINVKASLEEARQQLLELGYSRVPIVGETTDDIVGILYAKDLLKHINSSGSAALSEIVREPLYVPETTGIDKLLETMKRERVHLAIVVDEYSGVAGLVTIEDILEEIVGEIVDEYDAAEETGIKDLGSNTIEVDARVHIDDLNDQFGYKLPEDGDFETIGGFVLNELSRVPKSAESFAWRQLRITILEADKRKLHKLRIEVDHSLTANTAE